MKLVQKITKNYNKAVLATSTDSSRCTFDLSGKLALIKNENDSIKSLRYKKEGEKKLFR